MSMTGKAVESLETIESILEIPCETNFTIKYKKTKINNDHFIKGKLFQITVSFFKFIYLRD